MKSQKFDTRSIHKNRGDAMYILANINKDDKNEANVIGKQVKVSQLTSTG